MARGTAFDQPSEHTVRIDVPARQPASMLSPERTPVVCAWTHDRTPREHARADGGHTGRRDSRCSRQRRRLARSRPSHSATVRQQQPFAGRRAIAGRADALDRHAVHDLRCLADLCVDPLGEDANVAIVLLQITREPLRVALDAADDRPEVVGEDSDASARAGVVIRARAPCRVSRRQ